MTAFGRHRATIGGKEITAEIKSVNNRYLDCSVRMSRSYSFLEEKIKPYLLSRGILRGKVDVSITVETAASGSVSVSLDEGYARGYIAALRQLRDEFGLADDISVMTVARNPSLFTLKTPEEDAERDWQEILSVFSVAVDNFIAGREREGANLIADIRGKMDRIRGLVAEIGALSEADVKGYRSRLEERLRAVLSDNDIRMEESRILTECAIFADRVAVDEELVRLGSHFDAFEEIAASDEPAGRKFDFLLQEMNREINTTGSKCSDAAIARLVVEVKNELEKIREQVQNIE